MEFATKTTPVNLIMNGRYLGTYSMGPQIRVSENAVDIDDLTKKGSADAVTEPEITGGYLLTFDVHDPDMKKIVTEHGQIIGLVSPDFEEKVNEAQLNWITDRIRRLEDALYGEVFRDASGKSYTEYLDLTSAADYYLLQQVAKNGDGISGGSTYFYRKRGGKLYFGPLWDFDYCPWGAMQEPPEGFNIPFQWFERLTEDEVFMSRVKERWSLLKSLLEEAVSDGGLIDRLSGTQYTSQQYNYMIWPVRKEIPNPAFDLSAIDFTQITELPPARVTDESATYDGEIAAMKEWIRQRIVWVDEALNR